jgi:hypothetical protein
MGVKDQMIKILRSGEAARINFSFNGSGGRVSVGPETFTRVAEALERGQISVVENRFPGDIAMYSARSDAANNYAANTFYLGNNPRYSRLFGALICHEAVHASFDLTRSTVPWIDNEAAAYIAQAYYARNSGLRIGVYDYGSPSRNAFALVEELRTGSGDISFFLDILRDSLRASPLYHGYINGTFTGDG